MNVKRTGPAIIGLRLLVPLFFGFLLAIIFITFVKVAADEARAATALPAIPSAPINPPAGYAKLILSHKSVTPSLASTGGAVLHYRIEIINTGAYTGFNVIMTDTIPAHTIYRNDAVASRAPAPTFLPAKGALSWNGTVGFNSTTVISFSVNVTTTFSGVISNTAVISHSSLTRPLRIFAEAMITDDPLFKIEKISTPAIPGANKPLTYTITIKNVGQAATNLPVTVTDDLPQNTAFLRSVGGTYTNPNKTVTWKRNVTLPTGGTSDFIYAVTVGSVPSGTVITNNNYKVQNPESGIAVGNVYTVTVLKPILFLYKETDPFPPGSNREMTYTLIILNKGSLATNLVISDTFPISLTYVRSNGSRAGNVITWNIPKLDSGQSAEVYFVVFVGDVAEVSVINGNYKVCSAEGVCETGVPLTSVIEGPTFVTTASLDPIAKKPGGGGGPVTPTLTIQNIGPGDALDAQAILQFGNISVSNADVIKVIPASAGAVLSSGACGAGCTYAYKWVGDLAVGELVTFTVIEGQSTIGGSEGNLYTATVVVTDTLGSFTSEPITATAVGRVTHFANLIPEKSAPPLIGAGQTMTYTIAVFQ